MNLKWDAYVNKAQYIEKQNEPVLLRVETTYRYEELADVKIEVVGLDGTRKTYTDLNWEKEKPEITKQYSMKKLQEETELQKIDQLKTIGLIDLGIWSAGGYGVELFKNEELVFTTAFDVVASPRDQLRYGFLSQFSNEDGDEADILFANKLHLNMIQFYDWMYRHDKLVPQTDQFVNPLGCNMSKEVIKKKIKDCTKYGIRSYAYAAVYAAGKDFYEQHKEWAMYHLGGEPMIFANWLVYMNCEADCGWNEYLRKQFQETMEVMGFDGIHMDTYGYPKCGWDSRGKLIQLEETFPVLINQSCVDARETNSDAGMMFNAVNDWPLEALAMTGLDGMYIEVWPPNTTYRDLYLLIRKALMASKKEVILAAYIKPFKTVSSQQDYLQAEKTSLLTFAVINASGGHQLAYGEKNGILADGYFVDHAVLREEFIPMLRCYHDFAVRYSSLIFNKDMMDISMTASDGINEDIVFSCEDRSILFGSKAESNKVWCLIKEKRSTLMLHMINLVGENDNWNEAKSETTRQVDGIKIRMVMEKQIRGVWYATPDDGFGSMQEIPYQITNEIDKSHIELVVPRLQVWGMLWFEFETEGGN